MTEVPEAARAAADTPQRKAALGAAEPGAVDTDAAEPGPLEPDPLEPDPADTEPDAKAQPDAMAILRVPGGLPGPAGAGSDGPAGAEPERMRAITARFSGGWPLGRIIGVGLLVAALFSLLAIIVGGVALADLASARSRVVDTLDPAALHASQLDVALLNQETGVRGYVLSGGQPGFLRPYWSGLAQQRTHIKELRPLLSSVPGGLADLPQVITRINAWRRAYAGTRRS